MTKRNRDHPLRTIDDPTGRADWLRSRGEGHPGFSELLRPGSGKRPKIAKAIMNKKRWRPSTPRATGLTVVSAPATAVTLAPPVALSVPTPSERQSPGVSAPSREGQTQFRATIIAAYGQCAITGCRDEPALQAAHIIPYVDERSHVVRNGICLRADIHCLYDRDMIRIGADGSVWVSDAVSSPEYRFLHGRVIAVPADAGNRPCRTLLAQRHKYV